MSKTFDEWAKGNPELEWDGDPCERDVAAQIRNAARAAWDAATEAAQPQWVPVSERMPPADVTVIVLAEYDYGKPDYFTAAKSNYSGKLLINSNGRELKNPRFWCRIDPSAPTRRAGER